MIMQLFICVFAALAATALCGAEFKYTSDKIRELKGAKDVKEFKKSNQIRVIYYYKMDIPRLAAYMKELQKAAEFLKLYGVEFGVCDCTLHCNEDVKKCNQDNVESNVFTYRSGKSMLALDLQTMFDVNSIMSNILQLVLLREVPILQTVDEVKDELKKYRGKYDVIFGHMKAIGTFDHRVFMEVAYVYSDKIKFAITTDRTATSILSEQPVKATDASNLWYIWTKSMAKDDDDTNYHGTLYKGEINLAALAKYVKALTRPKMFDFPADGLDNPYKDLDIKTVRIYYRIANRMEAYQNAHLIAKHYAGILGVLLIDLDRKEEHGILHMDGPGPILTFTDEGAEAREEFFTASFDADTIADFLQQRVDNDVDLSKADEADEEDHYVASSAPSDGAGVNFDEVETQDDKVEEAVLNARKVPMSLDRVPALTDKTFPLTISNTNIALILFYFPFDAVSLANLRLLGEATELLGDSTSSIQVARVNCYDWTDVCGKHNITIYPTLRVFSQGKKPWDYKGPQDVQAFFSTIKIFEFAPPVYVTDPVDVSSYLLGQDESIKQISNTTVVGLFSKQHEKEKEVFRQVAEAALKKNRLLYAYTDIAEAKQISSQFDVSLPAIILSKFDDSIQPHMTYTGDFTMENIEQFVTDNKLPQLPVLTPLMFPELRRRGSHFLILFTDGSTSCQQPEETVREIVKAQTFKNISFTLMPVPSKTSVGYKVLKEYSPKPAIPFISYVNLKKGDVYNFDRVKFEQGQLTSWIGAIVEGSMEPSTVLVRGKWEPKNKGYEFLKIIDSENEEKRKRMKGNVEGETQQDEEDMDDNKDDNEYKLQERLGGEDDAEVRKDLHNLGSSRLYHIAPGRASKIQEGKEPAEGRTTGHDPSEL